MPSPTKSPAVAYHPAGLTQRFRQVLRTYTTHRFFWVGVAFVALMMIPLFVAGSSGSTADGAPPLFFGLSIPLLFVTVFLVGQSKMQLAHPRARLLPAFYGAHILVLGAILLVSLLLYPLLISFATGLPVIGLLALTMTMAVPVLWGFQLNRAVFTLAPIVVFYSLLTEWGRRWWLVEAEAHRFEHGLIIAAGALLAIAWLWRISRMTEEQEDYQNIMQMMLARRTGSEAVEQRRIIATQVRRSWLACWVGDRWHARLAPGSRAARPSMPRLFAYGFGAIPVEVQGIMMLATFLAMGLFAAQLNFRATRPAFLGWGGFLAIFAILLPGQMAGELLAQRRPRMANELLWPLSRSEFIAALFGSAIRNGMLLWMFLVIPLPIGAWAISEPLGLPVLATFFVQSFAVLIVAMGISLRAAMSASVLKRIFIQWVAWMLLVMQIIAWWNLRNTIGDAPFLLIAVVLVAIGLWLIRQAHRAWMNFELG